MLNLSRQSKLVPEDVNNYTIKVFGVGSVGSHVVKTLAKSGFRNIEVYDMDIVAEENIAAQAFDIKHIDMNKVEAMGDICKESAGLEIKQFHGEITEETEITPEANTIYCCFFDSFAARKMVFDKVKDFPVIFVDGRIGEYNMRHYMIDCSEKETMETYAKTLETKAVSELECGEKASAPINVQLAGKIVMNIVAYIKGKDYVKIYIGNAMTPKNDIVILHEKPKEEEDVAELVEQILEGKEDGDLN